MNPVVHFEMPYDDKARMARFYESAFGWQMRMLGEDMGNYVVATTTETGDAGPKTAGAINGGFFPKKPDWPPVSLGGSGPGRTRLHFILVVIN